MINMITKFKIFEYKANYDHSYEIDKSKFDILIKNARKWKEKDFIEEYVYLYDIRIPGTYSKAVRKGEEVELAFTVQEDGKMKYGENGLPIYKPYKKIIAEKDYSDSSHWKLILDNTKDIQEEAKKLYDENKDNPKPKLKKGKTIRGYHSTKNKFEQFKYGMDSASGQIGADQGFFFFKELKFAKYYASVLKENHGVGYIYDVDIRLGKSITEKGEEIGTLWGRAGWLEQIEMQGYDTAIIEDADTGYGITDEIIVFDDDNIKINEIIKI